MLWKSKKAMLIYWILGHGVGGVLVSGGTMRIHVFSMWISSLLQLVVNTVIGYSRIKNATCFPICLYTCYKCHTIAH